MSAMGRCGRPKAAAKCDCSLPLKAPETAIRRRARIEPTARVTRLPSTIQAPRRMLLAPPRFHNEFGAVAQADPQAGVVGHPIIPSRMLMGQTIWRGVAGSPQSASRSREKAASMWSLPASRARLTADQVEM